MIKQLPQCAQKLIQEYKSLQIEGKDVHTPYFRNVKRVRGELRVLVGKGTPQELIDETKIFAKLRGFELSKADSSQIREFMISQGLGLDCSGLACHLVDTMLKANGHANLGIHLNKSPYNFVEKIAVILKFAQFTSALALTSEYNTSKIKLSEILPGDLVRLRGARRGDHIVIISEVTYDDKTGLPTDFTYVHSTPHYGNLNGLKFGKVIISDINGELKDQEWLEVDEQDPKKRNWTHIGLLNEYEDNGIRRLKFYKKMYN